MKPDRSPLSRPVDVLRLLKNRGEATVEASPEECAALAADFNIPAIRDLVGRFTLRGSAARLSVTGTVEAVVTQTCAFSLEPFEAPLNEAVDVDFSDADAFRGIDPDALDIPDPIIDGRIDLGHLTAEFVALGLDPFPRKPGVTFAPVSVGEEVLPFAGLAKLREPD